MKLDHAALAVAASVGRVHFLVYSRPRVAILATGNELVDIDFPPGPNQIRNSNTYSLAAQIAEAGGEPVLLPIAPDDPARIKELIREGLDADLLAALRRRLRGKVRFRRAGVGRTRRGIPITGVKIQPHWLSGLRTHPRHCPRQHPRHFPNPQTTNISSASPAIPFPPWSPSNDWSGLVSKPSLYHNRKSSYS